jgi:hypothetical protein
VVDPWLRLAAGVLARAAEQASEEGDAAACDWLQSLAAETYCDALGVDVEAVRRQARDMLARAKGRIVIRLFA